MSYSSMLGVMMVLKDSDEIVINKCLCLPNAELNTKNSTKRRLSCCLVQFLVFNSIHQKKSDSSKTLNREEDDVICGWPLRVKCTTIVV